MPSQRDRFETELSRALSRRITSQREMERQVAQLANMARWEDDAAPLVQPDRTPAGRLAHNVVMDAIEPTVRELRQHLFRSDDAPFTPDTYREAACWIDEEHERHQRVLTEEDNQRLDALEAEIAKKVGEHEAISGEIVVVSYRWEGLHYWRPSETDPAVLDTVNLPIGRKQPLLHRLAVDSNRLAKATGFSQPMVVAHVLAGVEPDMPLWRFNVTKQFHDFAGGRSLNRATATIELNDFGFAGRERVLREWLKRLNGKESAKDRADDAFIMILRRVGPVPTNPPLSFWEDTVLPAWLAAGLNVSRKATALQKRWYDLQESERWKKLPEWLRRELSEAA